MAGALLLGLERDRHVAPVDRRLDLLAALADHDDALVGAERIDPVEQVEQQRPAGDRMQHLVRVRPHARALPGGKDDNGKTALIGHGASNGMAERSAPDFSLKSSHKRKGRPRRSRPRSVSDALEP